MYHYDAANTGYNPDATGPTTSPEVAWRYSTCEPADGAVIVADGRVLTDGRTYDGRTGDRFGAIWSGRGHTGAAAGDTLFVSDRDLHARNLDTHARRWTFETDGSMDVLGPPTVAGGTVFVPGTLQDPTLYAVDASEGTERWRFGTDSRLSRPPAVSDGVAFIADRTPRIYAVSSDTGERRWTQTLDESVWQSAPTVENGTVYLGSWEESVIALDAADGTEQWRTDVGYGIRSSLAVTPDVVFAAGTGGWVSALDAADGTIIWQTQANNYELHSPVVTDETVFAGAFSGGTNVCALTASDGTERWQFETAEQILGDTFGRGIHATPAVVDDVLFVSTGGGDVYALAGDA